MTKCKSFSASINNDSRILILGSMPGVKSLDAQEYYAHPQNRFWKVLGILCNKDLTKLNYQMKLETLLGNGIALWDVLADCTREGSLDSAIENETPNDIRKLLKKYPAVKTIALNGNKAYSAFCKYFQDIVSDEGYNILKLPSTSPANARYQMGELLKDWQKINIK